MTLKIWDTAGQERVSEASGEVPSPTDASFSFSTNRNFDPTLCQGPDLTQVSPCNSLAPMYYRNASAAVVVYDITNTSSLEKAKSWIRELQRQADPQIVVALVGNKADLTERREIETEVRRCRVAVTSAGKLLKNGYLGCETVCGRGEPAFLRDFGQDRRQRVGSVRGNRYVLPALCHCHQAGMSQLMSMLRSLL